MNRDFAPFALVLVVAVCVATPLLLSAPSSGSPGEITAAGSWIAGELNLIAGLMVAGALLGGGALLLGRRGLRRAQSSCGRSTSEVEQIALDEPPPSPAQHSATPATTPEPALENSWEGVSRALEKELLGKLRYLDPTYAERELVAAVRDIKAQARDRGRQAHEMHQLKLDHEAARAELHRRRTRDAQQQEPVPSDHLDQRLRRVIAIARHWREQAQATASIASNQVASEPETTPWADALTLLLESDASSVNGHANHLRAQGITVPRAAIEKGGPLSQLAHLKRMVALLPSPTAQNSPEAPVSERESTSERGGEAVNDPVNASVNGQNGVVNGRDTLVNASVNAQDEVVNGLVNAQDEVVNGLVNAQQENVNAPEEV